MGRFYRGGDRRHDLGRRFISERRRALDDPLVERRANGGDRRAGQDRRSGPERRTARAHLYDNPLRPG